MNLDLPFAVGKVGMSPSPAQLPRMPSYLFCSRSLPLELLNASLALDVDIRLSPFTVPRSALARRHLPVGH